MTAYTNVVPTRTDANSPADEDLFTDLANNDEYHFERAMRCGTDATGVRRTYACGREAWTITCSGSVGTTSVAITFSTDSEDGNPHFTSLAVPIITLALEEDDTGAEVDWGVTPTNNLEVYIESGSLDSTGFTAVIDVGNSAGATDVYNGFLHWSATGLVTVGE